MLRRVALIRKDSSEEHIASIIRATRFGELETTLAVISCYSLWWKRYFLRNVGSQKSYTASHARRRHYSQPYRVIGMSSSALFQCAILFLRVAANSVFTACTIPPLHGQTPSHPSILTEVRIKTLISCSVSVHAVPRQHSHSWFLASAMDILCCLTTLGDIQLLPACGHCVMNLIFLGRPSA
jgi:hypothetical protein